jgi:Flp pilus assembly secretin CpaC
MRRLSLAIAAALTLSGVSASAQNATRTTAMTGALPIRNAPATTPTDLPVAAGQASYVNLSGAVRDVVVGDPTIADVSVVNDRTLVVLGKRPGVTSLLAFGAGGRALADRQVVVSENGGGGVTVYRGATASNYACAAQCTRLGVAGATTP